MAKADVLRRGDGHILFAAPRDISRVQTPSCDVTKSRGTRPGTQGPPTAEVPVPGVVGLPLKSARDVLIAFQLGTTVVPVSSASDTAKVTAQSPAAGTLVDRGTRVQVTVSTGPKPEPVEVDNVIGQTYDVAVAMLQARGFSVERKEVDSDQPAGVVVGQDPSGGSRRPRGSTVTLSVSKGPGTLVVPDVTNQDVTIARETLRNANFHVIEEPIDTADPTQDGMVLSQDPAGGTEAKTGSVVTLEVGEYVLLLSAPSASCGRLPFRRLQDPIEWDRASAGLALAILELPRTPDRAAIERAARVELHYRGQ